ncbi:MAG: BtpA/SgcQ family protein [Cyanobacteria bacterium]|nr:BtpA/SgcQ family protein [Cyanobacteriota bacterium]
MFSKACSLIGAVHLPPLPGAAGFRGGVSDIVHDAIVEARKYIEGGFDALILENTHDTPYLKGHVRPETTAAMSVVANEIKNACKVPIGVQLLAGANLEALAVALAADLDFIRVEGFVYAHIGDEGIHESCAGELIRKRFELNAERIKIFADCKKKHSSHAITSDISLEETVRDAEYFRADGVVVTGIRTGAAPDAAEVRAAKEAVGIPVLVGSGVTGENLSEFLPWADAIIIGSSVKFDGLWQNPVDPDRCRKLVEMRCAR